MASYVIFICGGPRDGEVLMETINLNAALAAARNAEWNMDLLEDETIGIDTDDMEISGLIAGYTVMDLFNSGMLGEGIMKVKDLKKRLDKLNDDANLLPPAQPEIVRCKDCRWGREVCGNIECSVDSNMPPEYHGYEWFCPNGEGKE